ncbi:SAM-dependent methyltransferase [Falsiroseomonas oryzae]|uniref:SAM-dependent methyltransferase n=1 Tax=Falsiroseomonas oryzae TaxID=2766473 RepID=UPI0022EAB2D1|nr:methyltransferase [Roseomonas sp. MO-31]
MLPPRNAGQLRRAAAWILGQGRRLAAGLRTGDTLPPELRHAIHNTKLLGALLARQAYAEGRAGPGVAAPEHPVLVRLGGRLCRQEDIEAPWLHHWCARLGMVPLYHRKVWEECFVAQALWEAGMLAPGRRALGFAVGRELLPAFAAAQGVQVLATDLARGESRARIWHGTGQHAEGADHLFHPHLLPREVFDARVAFRAVDMAAIPDDLRRGGFDALWSVCAFEHLGSLESGLDFVLRAMDCLRPGGIAVHTTEYNLAETGPTLGSGVTVLYQRRHIEALGARLAAAGHQLLPVDFGTGGGVLDGFVDLPPFSAPDGTQPVADTPHLRKTHAEHVVTSIGLIIRAGAAGPKGETA